VRYIALLAALAALAGCSSAQSFTDVEGSVRISGQVQRQLFNLKDTTLSLYLTDAATGYPIDAHDVQVHTADGRTVAAKRAQLGSYSASIPDSDRIDVLVSAHDEIARLSLKRQ
jgi:hypothetical protein